jgi:hypothetical protein
VAPPDVAAPKRAAALQRTGLEALRVLLAQHSSADTAVVT